MAGQEAPEPLLPDGRTCIFVGAGLSKPAGVPTTVEFVEEFRNSLESEPGLQGPFDQIVDILRATSGSLANQAVDVESVLDALSDLRAPSRTVLAFYEKKALAPALTAGVVLELDSRLRLYIRQRCLVERSGLDYLVPIIRLLNTSAPLRIFSTNYDVVLDQFFAGTSLPLVDGFDQKWNPASLVDDSDPIKNQKILLYRLHGSVIWFQSSSFSLLKLPIKEGERGIKLLSGESAAALILYPAQKDITQAPFTFLLGEFQRELRVSPWWIVAGYSFRDPALLDCFLEAGSEFRELRLILVSPDAEDIFRKSLQAPPHRPGTVSPFDSKVSSDRVLRLPYRVEAVLGDLASSLLPGYKEAVAREYKSNIREIWGKSTWWYEAALEFARIGLLDAAETIEANKPDALKDELEWRLEYFGFKAIHAVALGREAGAKESWARFIGVYEALCDAEQPLSVFNGPNPGTIQVRAEFSYRIGEITHGLSAHNLAYVVNGLTKASSRAKRGREGLPRAGALSRVDHSLTELRSYLDAFENNGIRLTPYSELRRTAFQRQIEALENYVATNASGGQLPPGYVAEIQKILVPVEKSLQEVHGHTLSVALDGDWDQL